MPIDMVDGRPPEVRGGREGMGGDRGVLRGGWLLVDGGWGMSSLSGSSSFFSGDRGRCWEGVVEVVETFFGNEGSRVDFDALRNVFQSVGETGCSKRCMSVPS